MTAIAARSRSSSRGGSRVAVARAGTEPFQVAERTHQPCQRLARERAGLPFAGRLVGGGADLVRGQALQQLAPPVEQTEVRPEELVRRADKEVRTHRDHVDGHVRGGVDRVHVSERARRVSHRHDARDGVQGSDRVGGQPYRDDARPWPQGPLEAVQVESAVLPSDLDPANPNAALSLELQPGRDVGVVIQACDHHFVAGLQGSTDGSAHGKGQSRHVLAEDHLRRVVGAQKVGRGGVGLGQDGVALLARGECALVVGVAALEVGLHGVDGPARHLRAAGAVQVDVRTASVIAAERRELRPHGGEG